MTVIRAGLFGRRLIVFEVRIKTLPAIRFGQLQVDAAGRLFAVGHGIGYVRCARDKVSACVKARTAGFKCEAIDLDRSAFFENEARSSGKIEVDGFSNRENDRVAVEALDF